MMQRYFITFLLFLAVGLTAHATSSNLALAQPAKDTATTSDIELNNLLTSARSSYWKRDWVSGLDGYSRYLEARPGDESARFERSQCFFRLGRYAQAIRDLSYLIKQKKGPTPTDEIALEKLYYRRGLAYHTLGRDDLAHDDFIKSSEGSAFYQYNNWHFSKRIAALDEHSRKQTVDENVQRSKAGPLVEKARKAYDWRDFDDAYRLYTQAIELDPNLAPAYLGRGTAAEAQKDIDGARADYTSAILADAHIAEAFYLRAKTYESSDEETALSDHQEACRLGHPSSCRYLREAAEIWEGRGLVFLRVDNFKRALEAFSKAVEVDPLYADPYFNRALVYSKTDQYLEAVKNWETYIIYAKASKAPAAPYGEAYFNIGLNYYRSGQPQQAVEAYTQAIAHDRRSAPEKLPRDLHHRARIYYEAGGEANKRRALDDLREACRMGDRMSCDMCKKIAVELGLKP
ncbi:MAG TPA: tetratricopeptide repeat protein [Desulfobacteraceae bacterium]|nr:tetratricopeptide repeat protein [Desulfobacteraceae bacterium]